MRIFGGLADEGARGRRGNAGAADGEFFVGIRHCENLRRARRTAWTPTSEGEQISSAGNYYLWSNYPPAVRKWIIQHGGLHAQIIYLSGPELAAMYPACH